MNLFTVGRLCVKLAGRDAGQYCVVVEPVDNLYVVVDGATRRRRVNVKHLEPLAEILDIGKGTSENVTKAFAARGLNAAATKPKQVGSRPHKTKVKRDSASANHAEKASVEEKLVAKGAKKAAKKDNSNSVEEKSADQKQAVKKVAKKTAV